MFSGAKSPEVGGRLGVSKTSRPRAAVVPRCPSAPAAGRCCLAGAARVLRDTSDVGMSAALLRAFSSTGKAREDERTERGRSEHRVAGGPGAAGLCRARSAGRTFRVGRWEFWVSI